MCEINAFSFSALGNDLVLEPSTALPDQFLDVDIRDTQKVYLPHSSASKLFARPAPAPNLSRVLPGSCHSRTIHMPHYNRAPTSVAVANPCRASDIKRWDAGSRTYSGWDGLHHDDELWSRGGDCLVHLYGKGRSRRSPSFKVSLARLEAVGSAPLFEECLVQTRRSSNLSDSGYPSASSADVGFELYVPAPEHVDREDTFLWHVATRNFFAWVSNKPLVGATLGQALIGLLQNMHLFRSERADNVHDILAYAERLGYLDFRHCPDYALAFLNFAEHYRLRDLWLDAFAHCVGMNDRLCLSPEFGATSKVTRALITRAYLEMDLHLGRVSRALRGFLEEELSPSNFGLSIGAQAHLDRFRSFLHSFYVNKFGYWPPERSAVLSSSLLRSLYFEFQNLYEFIVDMDSSDVLHDKPASGGICVLQNVNAFNGRHNYEPLPHPLPLLPDYDSSRGKTHSQRSLRSFKLGSKNAKFEQGMTIKTALAMATNTVSAEVLECPLVRDYVSFEREWSPNPQEKISIVDARKVRWIAIYCILQMLISVTRAPKEVRITEDTSYPLCLLTTGTPPWDRSRDYSKSGGIIDASAMCSVSDMGSPSDEAAKAYSGQSSPALSIHPDCEADDYFLHGSVRKRSDPTSPLRPAPLRVRTAPVTRTSSIRSIQRSVMSMSFSPRRSSVKGSPISRRPASVSDTKNEFGEPCTSRNKAMSALPEARTPVLDVFMLEHTLEPTLPEEAHASSSPSSVSSPKSTSSSLSDRDDTDACSWSSNDERRNSKVYNMDHESVYDETSSAPSSPGLTFGTWASASKFTHRRNSILSSSVHTEKRSQANDTAELQRRSQQIIAPDTHDAQQMNLPTWWSGDSSPRPGSSASNRHGPWPFAVSVPQEVPEDEEMIFQGREHSRCSKADDNVAGVDFVDIYGALDLLPASITVGSN